MLLMPTWGLDPLRRQKCIGENCLPRLCGALPTLPKLPPSYKVNACLGVRTAS